MGARKDLALRSIRKKFEEWRRCRRHGEEIPASLWDEVHSLESHFGRTNLAKALRLNSSDMAFQMNLRGAGVGGPLVSAVSASRCHAHEAATAQASTTSHTIAITKVVSVPFEAAGPLTGVVAEVESPSGWVLRLRSAGSAEILAAFVDATSRMGGAQ
jgi:hypothetical protein